MSNIWVISPYGSYLGGDVSSKHLSDDPFVYTQDAWKYDLIHNTIALGSLSLRSPGGDFVNPEGKSFEELISIIKNNHSDYSDREVHFKTKVIWQVYNNIQEGDFIIAKKGIRRILGIGQVFVKDGKVAYFSVKQGLERTGNKYNPYPLFINVKWIKDEVVFKDSIFRIGRFGSLYKMVVIKHQDKYIPLILREIGRLWKVKI